MPPPAGCDLKMNLDSSDARARGALISTRGGTDRACLPAAFVLKSVAARSPVCLIVRRQIALFGIPFARTAPSAVQNPSETGPPDDRSLQSPRRRPVPESKGRADMTFMTDHAAEGEGDAPAEPECGLMPQRAVRLRGRGDLSLVGPCSENHQKHHRRCFEKEFPLNFAGNVGKLKRIAVARWEVEFLSSARLVHLDSISQSQLRSARRALPGGVCRRIICF